jgi:hypothetical protein
MTIKYLFYLIVHFFLNQMNFFLNHAITLVAIIEITKF